MTEVKTPAGQVLMEAKAKGAVSEGRGSLFLFPLFCFSDNTELLGFKLKVFKLKRFKSFELSIAVFYVKITQKYMRF